MNEQTTLKIRGMVCDRCVSVVRRELEGLGISVLRTRLGLVTVEGTLSAGQLALVRSMLESEGFSLLNDRKVALLRNVKDFINGLVESGELAERNQRLSERLSDHFSVDYPALSALFSSSEGITLEKYAISQRLDKVRELLVYSDLPVADIAYQTGFGTVQHLSNQFKRETGLTPAFYRRIRREKERLQHDSVVAASA